MDFSRNVSFSSYCTIFTNIPHFVHLCVCERVCVRVCARRRSTSLCARLQHSRVYRFIFSACDRCRRRKSLMKRNQVQWKELFVGSVFLSLCSALPFSSSGAGLLLPACVCVCVCGWLMVYGVWGIFEATLSSGSAYLWMHVHARFTKSKHSPEDQGGVCFYTKLKSNSKGQFCVDADPESDSDTGHRGRKKPGAGPGSYEGPAS